MKEHLLKTDLNLLVSLNVIIEEKSLARAAERLNVTPSAMSKTLAKIRYLLGDQILVRGRDGMQLTLFAQELKDRLHAALSNLEGILYNEKFDPSKLQGKIRLALPETIGIYLVPKLLDLIIESGSKIQLQTQTIMANFTESISSNNMDYCLFLGEPSDKLFNINLGYVEPTILMSKNHPIAKSKKSFSKSDFNNQMHIINHTTFFSTNYCDLSPIKEAS